MAEPSCGQAAAAHGRAGGRAGQGGAGPVPVDDGPGARGGPQRHPALQPACDLDPGLEPVDQAGVGPDGGRADGAGDATVTLLTVAAIKLDSPGPVLFSQVRIGRNGRPFKCYKFRSMVDGAATMQEDLSALNEATGPLFKVRNDPRRTRVGRWLRRYSLDELPQLINVLRGEMSLVGPRPNLPDEVAQYAEWHGKRLTVSPGITGLWQVSGRSDLTFDEMVLLDIYYVENWSLTMDLSILLRSLPAVLRARGAY